MLTSIAARSKNGVIGVGGQLPWHLPTDLKRFRQLTRGGIVVMGRQTYDSIGRPLPQRENWILTRQSQLEVPGARVFHNPTRLIEELEAHDAWVIGGEQIYRLLLPYCGAQELTEVDIELPGDSFYPDFSEQDWSKVAEQPGPSDEPLRYRFCRYQRVSSARARPDGAED